jgi:hypothetical protein
MRCTEGAVSIVTFNHMTECFCTTAYAYYRNQQNALQEKKKGDREKAEKLKKTVIAPETNQDRVARLQQLPIKLAVDQDTSKSVPVGVLMKVNTNYLLRQTTTLCTTR